MRTVLVGCSIVFSIELDQSGKYEAETANPL